jgi:hypothetical protein
MTVHASDRWKPGEPRLDQWFKEKTSLTDRRSNCTPTALLLCTELTQLLFVHDQHGSTKKWHKFVFYMTGKPDGLSVPTLCSMAWHICVSYLFAGFPLKMKISCLLLTGFALHTCVQVLGCRGHGKVMLSCSLICYVIMWIIMANCYSKIFLHTLLFIYCSN